MIIEEMPAERLKYVLNDITIRNAIKEDKEIVIANCDDYKPRVVYISGCKENSIDIKYDVNGRKEYFIRYNGEAPIFAICRKRG